MPKGVGKEVNWVAIPDSDQGVRIFHTLKMHAAGQAARRSAGAPANAGGLPMRQMAFSLLLLLLLRLADLLLVANPRSENASDEWIGG